MSIIKTKRGSYPEQLDAVLHAKISWGRMSNVTQALWEALKRDEEALLMEFLKADKLIFY